MIKKESTICYLKIEGSMTRMEKAKAEYLLEALSSHGIDVEMVTKTTTVMIESTEKDVKVFGNVELGPL